MDQSQKVKRLVSSLVSCSSAGAGRAARAICQDPETLVLLGIACGLSSQVAVSGYTTTKAASIVQAWPVVLGGLALTGSGTLAAKRFCAALVRQGGSSINNTSKSRLRQAVAR